MDKKTASVVLFSICTMIVIGCGLWVRQLGEEAIWVYGFVFVFKGIPTAMFGWGLLMGCLAARPLWHWSLLAGLWEVLFMVVITDRVYLISQIFDFSLTGAFVFFYLLASAITAVGTVVGYGLYKLVHLKDEAA